MPDKSQTMSRAAASSIAERSADYRNVRVKSKYLNVIIWVTIALVVVLIGAWTIWASHQPELRSTWAPD